MNDEIKEILDRLERIDHREYSCDFEFADSATFYEMARCFEERKKMVDYITNLQQKYEELDNRYKNSCEEYQKLVEELTGENERLKDWVTDLINVSLSLKNGSDIK